LLFDLGYLPHQAAYSRPGERGTSLQELHARFPDEEACLRHVFGVRFPGDMQCPNCGGPTKWIARTAVRHIVHGKCRHIIKPYNDTIFQHSNWPIRHWLYAMLHVANSRTSIDGNFLSRELGVREQTARSMLTRIRRHLAAIDHVSVVGKPGDTVHIRLERPRRIYMPGTKCRKTAQLLCMAVGRSVRTIVTDIARPYRLRVLVRARIHPDAKVMTDCYHTQRVVSSYREYKRLTFDPLHFLDREPGSDSISAFITSFNRGVRAQHKHLRMPSMWLFLKEYEFRFNRRHRSHETFGDMLADFPSFAPTAYETMRAWNNDLPD
jgi:transposase